MSNPPNYLTDEYSIDTPENVSIAYEIAGIGSRFIGALVDIIGVGVLLAGLNMVLLMLLNATDDLTPLAQDGLEAEMSWVGGLILAGYALLNFIVFWGYFIAFELLLNGQSPGKSVAKTRVVRLDGNPAGALEVVIRNLVRPIDFLPIGYALGLITMFFNRQTRRLGDLAAGTLVVRERQTVELTSLTSRSPDPAPLSDDVRHRYPNIRRLTASDYDLIRSTLQAERDLTLAPGLLDRLAKAIAARLEMPPPKPPTHRAARQFLAEVAEVYEALGRED